MCTKLVYLELLAIVLFVLWGLCVAKPKIVKSNYNQVPTDRSGFRKNRIVSQMIEQNDTSAGASSGRGFFPHGGLLSLGKVLNFFPVGGERECQPEKYTVARSGICLNPYDCRQRDGKATGDCAHGLGVCCVFEATCGGTVSNNVTYFLSPGFPDLWTGERYCNVSVHKAHAGIAQMRLDFVHFTLGQPNRTTGECDEDAITIGEGASQFTICGQNYGQHLYYTFSSELQAREDEMPISEGTTISIRMRGSETARLWLIKLVQLPLASSAPHGCLQYFTENNGTIKTFNYASNGRHLAAHEYKSCIRRNAGFCAVRYSPCDPASFRVGQAGVTTYSAETLGPGSNGGPGTGFYGPDGSFAPPMVLMDEVAENTQNDTMQIMADTQSDELEGSGEDPQMAQGSQSGPVVTAAPSPAKSGVLSWIWSFIWPWSWTQKHRVGHRWSLFGQRSKREDRSLWQRWSPYAQHYLQREDEIPYVGYGNYGVGLRGHGRLGCKDRVTIPCDNEYFVASSVQTAGVCDPHHCGNSFCPGLPFDQCYVETSITPYAVTVHFGPRTRKPHPEDNIGACLRYTQIPCDS